MLPAASYPLQALSRRLQPVSLNALALVLGTGAAAAFAPSTALAQALSRPAEQAPITQAPPKPAPETADAVPIAFEADTVEYAEKGDTVTASGNVVLRREGQSVRADSVTWNRETGKIEATGDVRMVDERGNQLFTDSVELTDELKSGMLENLLLVLREGGRLAAKDGERLGNGDVILNHAAYTGCSVVASDGCPKEPTWKVVAKTVTYSEAEQRVRFSDARLQLFGAVQIPLLGLTISTDGDAVSGFLIPDLRSSPSNGIEVAVPYYWKIDKNRDLTGTLHTFTEAAPMASMEYRALTDHGAYQITGYATSSTRIPISGSNTTDPAGQDAFRGYIFANGKFQLDDNWSVTASIRRATDRTFLRRYDVSRDDRLRSMIDVERIDQDSYLSIAGYATQTMLSSRDQGQIPIALPAVDYRHRFDDPILGGTITTQANALALTRTDGQDTQRAFTSAQWSRRLITGMGQTVTFTGLARGDIYHSNENEATQILPYRGEAGWQSRAYALAAVDVEWPLVGTIFGGNQVFTPRVQFVASPDVKNFAIPNEDSRAVELETSNLFALNRFPGYDRIEDGTRVTYGLDWSFERPRWRIATQIGQSIRFSGDQFDTYDGSGLSGTISDIVGRTEVRYRDFVKVIHRYRLDKDNLAIRRNEFDAVVGNSGTYAEIGYTKLNRNFASTTLADGTETGVADDLLDREEVRAAGRVAFAQHWSLFGSAVINLTNSDDDDTSGSNGFQPLRTRIGAAYEDDCLQISLTWRRDYTSNGDAQKGNSFAIRFSLKNIGVH
ncbi:LPS-assembly protein LptD [Novosphingobium profundi]|uniref:LPS-assembly protein LptD n=1 Tax=Novosphingobium profundi TaxID=1774954 RepID=UPI001BDAD9B6|nr:LPS assembly protein LptD [Novosphingobium profundi]MBT0668580.1 LPS-assembly protein LptD [Novosphingobium profundi]